MTIPDPQQFIDAGNYEAAADIFLQHATNATDSDEKLRLFSKALEQIENISEVQTKQQRLVSFYGQRADILRNKGDLKTAVDDLTKQIEAISEAYPGDIWGSYGSRNTQVELLVKLGRYQEAEQVYNEMVRVFGDEDASLYANRGALYREHLKDYGKAIADYKKVLEIEAKQGKQYPDDIFSSGQSAYEGLGLAYLLMNNYRDAEQAFSKALEYWPENVLFYGNRALCYYNLARYPEAIQDGKKALSLDHDDLNQEDREMLTELVRMAKKTMKPWWKFW